MDCVRLSAAKVPRLTRARSFDAISKTSFSAVKSVLRLAKKPHAGEALRSCSASDIRPGWYLGFHRETRQPGNRNRLHREISRNFRFDCIQPPGWSERARTTGRCAEVSNGELLDLLPCFIDQGSHRPSSPRQARTAKSVSSEDVIQARVSIPAGWAASNAAMAGS